VLPFIDQKKNVISIMHQAGKEVKKVDAIRASLQQQRQEKMIQRDGDLGTSLRGEGTDHGEDPSSSSYCSSAYPTSGDQSSNELMSPRRLPRSPVKQFRSPAGRMPIKKAPDNLSMRNLSLRSAANAGFEIMERLD